MKYPAVLVSAYDLHHVSTAGRNELAADLQNMGDAGRFILLDSGNYESFWHRDAGWTNAEYERTCSQVPSHLAFCYDKPPSTDQPERIAAEVVASVLSAQSELSGRTICPIIHGPCDSLPTVAKLVAEELRPLLLAVPERALGDGLACRAKRVLQIRRSLDENGAYTPLHLLGTGNPLAVAIYTCHGVDSFDGLEWCQTVVDHETGHLHHFQQWDLFASQTPFGGATALPYAQRVLAHNLLFYDAFMIELGKAVRDDAVQSWLAGRFPASVTTSVTSLLGGSWTHAAK